MYTTDVNEFLSNLKQLKFKLHVCMVHSIIGLSQLQINGHYHITNIQFKKYTKTSLDDSKSKDTDSKGNDSKNNE